MLKPAPTHNATNSQGQTLNQRLVGGGTSKGPTMHRAEFHLFTVILKQLPLFGDLNDLSANRMWISPLVCFWTAAEIKQKTN